MNGIRVVRILSFMPTHLTRPGFTRCPSSVLRDDADRRGGDGAQRGDETEDGKEETHGHGIAVPGCGPREVGARISSSRRPRPIPVRGATLEAQSMRRHVMKP